jgi:hypothetical protein
MNIKFTSNYFDKKTPEEDVPVIVDTQVQMKYQQLEEIYEKFFTESTLSLAKVFIFF